MQFLTLDSWNAKMELIMRSLLPVALCGTRFEVRSRLPGLLLHLHCTPTDVESSRS